MLASLKETNTINLKAVTSASFKAWEGRQKQKGLNYDYTKLKKEVGNMKHCMLKYPRFANPSPIKVSAARASAEP